MSCRFEKRQDIFFEGKADDTCEMKCKKSNQIAEKYEKTVDIL